MRPAFGWAHTEMVRCIDKHVEHMVSAYHDGGHLVV